MKTLITLLAVFLLTGCATTSRYALITTQQKEKEGECLVKLDQQTGEVWRMCPGSGWARLPDTTSYCKKTCAVKNCHSKRK